jgi:RHS repeat-associated protein
MLSIATLVGSVLVAIETTVAPAQIAAQAVALVDPTPPPSTIVLTSDVTEFAAGSTATLTATVDIALEGSASTIKIKDLTAGTQLKACTTGTTCTVATSFTSGAAHQYVATVSTLTSNEVEVSRQAWTVDLATDKSVFAAGETVTLTATANQNVGSTSSAFKIYIIDKTTGVPFGSCSTGTTCVIATANPFKTGDPHTYAAYVAKPGSTSLAGLTQVQANSSDVTVGRQAWVVTMTSNTTSYAAGDSVTFVATANQNVGNTSSNYRIYIYDVTTGVRLTYCSTGTTCTSTTTALYTSGAPHEYQAVVAKTNATTYSTLLDIQALSNPIVTDQATWAVVLQSSNLEFASNESVTLAATANQSVSGTSGTYNIYVFDTTLGTLVTSCSTGASCTKTMPKFYTGGPHTFVALVAAAGTIVTSAEAQDIQATSNEITETRKPWTLSLVAANPNFATNDSPDLTATPNQAVSFSGSPYAIFIFDRTTGARVTKCYSNTCTGGGSFLTGGPHEYVALVGKNTDALSEQAVLDVQVVSETVSASRLMWTITLGAAPAAGATVQLFTSANQFTNTAYNRYILDFTTGFTVDVYDPSSPFGTYVSRNNGHMYVAFIASKSKTTWPYVDIQAMSGSLLNVDPSGPNLDGEDDGGSNPSEKACQCSHADPVNTATGEFYLPATDTVLSGVGPTLGVSRTYSMNDSATAGAFGYGWSANFESKLTVKTPGDTTDPLPRVVEITQENGSTVLFSEDFEQHYIAPPRVMATLTNDSTTGLWTFTRQSDQVLVFDATGRIVSASDTHDNSLGFSYNTSNQLETISASGGRQIDLTWASGRVSQVSDSAGRVVAYGYDVNGNLTSVTGVDGKVTSYGYNASHYMTSLTKPGGRTTTNLYDAYKRLIKQTDPLGRITTFSYSAGTATITAPDGSKTVETYSLGRLASQTLAATTPLAATTSYTYDTASNLTSVTDPAGRTNSYTYDSDGNMLSAFDPLGRTTRWTYNSERKPTTKTDPLGKVTTFEYDTAGDLVKITSPMGRETHWAFNDDGTPSSTEDASGHSTTYDYDSAGRLLSVTDPNGRTTSLGYNSAGQVTSQTSPSGATTSVTLDAVGQTLSQTGPLGFTTNYSYNAAGDLSSVLLPTGATTSYAYDSAGQLTSTTDAAGKTTHFVYSAAGKLVSVEDANGHISSSAYNALGQVTSSTDPLGRVTSYGYDLAGRPTTTTAPSGAISTVAYDVAGQATSTTDALGATTSFVYTFNGQLKSVTDPLGRVTSTSYNDDGLPVAVTMPDSSTQLYQYNASGQVTTFTNADGKDASYDYNNSGQLTSKTEPGGLVTGYSYDPAGRLHVIAEPGDTTQTLSYDSANQITGVHYSATGTTDVEYEYDALGNTTSMSDSTGTSAYVYDSDGRLVSLINGAGARVGYGYDDVGQLTSLTYPNNETVHYTYDAAGQMASVTDWANHATAFTWTADGQLAVQSDANGLAQSNSYDSTGQLLTSQVTSAAGVLASFGYSYDAAGQISGADTTLGDSAVSSDYGYDPISQLTSATTTVSGQAPTVASPVASSAGLLTTTIGGGTVAYNSAQQATSLTPILSAATAFAYDARGSRVSATTGTDATTYAYAASGTLAEVTTPTASVSYTSDGHGLRQSRTEGGVTKQFTWSSVGGLPLLLDDSDYTYLYGPSSTPLAQVDDTTGETQYLHADILGTPRLITDESGASVGTRSYDAFGNLTAHTGTQSAFGFTGNLIDTTTGLLYLRARDYDAATGQFLSVDPAVDSTRQPYAYTGNNPVCRIDLTGLDWVDDLLGAPIVAVAGVATGGFAWDILSSNDAEAQIIGGWLLGQSGSDTTYGENSALVKDMKGMTETWRARGKIIMKLHEGSYSRSIDAGYRAGSPGLSNANFVADMFTFLDWGMSDYRARLRAALGTYDLAVSLVCVDSENRTAIIEFNGGNTTSLGSAIGWDKSSRDFWNAFANFTGLGTSVNQHFSWQEQVRY